MEITVKDSKNNSIVSKIRKKMKTISNNDKIMHSVCYDTLIKIVFQKILTKGIL